MAEVERKLAEMSDSGASSSLVSTREDDNNPTERFGLHISDWAQILGARQPPRITAGGDGEEEGVESNSPLELMSWSGLGGYILMAGIGVGVVASEVIVGKILGLRR
jgi:hypothetical protein